MGKFAFKLEPLFEHRKNLLDIKQKEFGEAKTRLAEEEERLVVLREVYRKSSTELDALKEKGGQTFEMGIYSAWLARMKGHLAEQERLIEKAAEELEEKRKKLVEASKNKKAVEVMKDKSFTRFVREESKRDQKETDDIVSTRFGRSGK